MSAPELKPCPFCGGKATTWTTDAYSCDSAERVLGCEECNTYTPYASVFEPDKVPASYVDAWNTRAALEPGPDHAEWNAAIEAAAQAVPQGWCQPSTSHIEMDVDLGQGIQSAIRALKKGSPSD